MKGSGNHRGRGVSGIYLEREEKVTRRGLIGQLFERKILIGGKALVDRCLSSSAVTLGLKIYTEELEQWK